MKFLDLFESPDSEASAAGSWPVFPVWGLTAAEVSLTLTDPTDPT